MSAAKNIAIEYFKSHSKDEVIKAYYAYHCLNSDEKSHNFINDDRNCMCLWCGRSRELVRWDPLPAWCLNRPAFIDVEEIIKNEESKAYSLLDKASKFIPSYIKKHGISGRVLSILHHTYGFDPEIVSSIVEIDNSILTAYYEEMEKERQISRLSQKKTIILAK